MSNFERTIAFIGIGLAAITATLFYVQLNEMASQTQILASQNESAAAGGLFDQMNTRRQLAIAQQQAKAAQDSAKAIQQQTEIGARPWLEISEIALVGGITINMKGEAQSTAHIVTQNIGKTPARQVSLMVELGAEGREHQEVKRLCTMSFVSTEQMGKYGQVLFPTETLGKNENQNIVVNLKPLTLVERKPAGTGYSESLRLDKNGPPPSQEEIIFPMPSSVIGCIQYKSFTSEIPYYTGFTYRLYSGGKDVNQAIYNIRFDRRTGEVTTTPATILKGNGSITVPFEWIGLVPNRGWGNDVVR